MKNLIFTLLALTVMGLFGQNVSAQIVTEQAIVCVGGVYEGSDPTDWVLVETVDPASYEAVVFDTIFTQSVQSVVVEGDRAWVAAQDSLVAYDIATYTRIAAVAVTGASKLAISGEILILSRQYPATEDFVKIYNAQTLELLETISDVPGESAEITMIGDVAYVAVNFGYAGTAGTLAAVNLTDYSTAIYDLGENAKGIYSLISEENIIYCVNNTAYGAAAGSISVVDLDEMTVVSYEITGNLNKGLGLKDGLLYVGFNNGVSVFDPAAETFTEVVSDQSGANSLSIASGAVDLISGNIWLSMTDFYSVGEGTVFGSDGALISPFTCGISTEAIAFQYRDNTSVEALAAEEVVAYPNPFSEALVVDAELGSEVMLFSVAGQLIFRAQSTGVMNIDTDGLTGGVYLLRVVSETGASSVRKVIKR